jgi:signal transduction histidine kinase
MQGGTLERPYEQLLKRKDDSEAVLQVNVSLVSGEGRPHGFQYIARDITEEKRLQENLRFYHQQVTRAQEEERRRIARELHDDTMQLLYALARRLDNFIRTDPGLGQEEVQFLGELHSQMGETVKSIQRFSQALRPPMLDELGFLPSVRWWLGEVRQRSNLETNLKVTGSEKRFGSEQELALFRAVQEAISNVERHAQATRLEVAVQMSDSRICVSVSDDGVGFAPPGHLEDLPRTGKLGLAGMHERVKLLGGTVRISSAPGKGTTVELTIPA